MYDRGALPGTLPQADISSVGGRLAQQIAEGLVGQLWKSIMRSRGRAGRVPATFSASNCTRLPGIAFGRPLVVVVKNCASCSRRLSSRSVLCPATTACSNRLC